MKLLWKALCIISCAMIGTSVILPYFSVSGLGLTVSKKLMDSGDGIILLIIACVALVLSLFGKFFPVVFLGGASLVFFFVENNKVTTNLGKEIDALARTMVQNDIGYYCLLVGSIALMAFSVFGLAGGKNK